MLLLEVPSRNHNEEEESNRAKHGEDEASEHLVAELSEHIAHLLPLDVGVPVHANETDGSGGSAAGGEECHHH